MFHLICLRNAKHKNFHVLITFLIRNLMSISIYIFLGFLYFFGGEGGRKIFALQTVNFNQLMKDFLIIIIIFSYRKKGRKSRLYISTEIQV